MIPYKITSYDLKGSIKPEDSRVQDIELPEGVTPIGFDIFIKDIGTGSQYIDWWFYTMLANSEELKREWVDDAHTEFVCIMDGKLKRFKIITRVYCMPKAAGVPVPGHGLAEENLNLRKDMAKVAKYEVVDPRITEIINSMGTPGLTAKKIWNPTHESLGNMVFSLLNEGSNVFIEKGNDAVSMILSPYFSIVIRVFRKERKCQK